MKNYKEIEDRERISKIHHMLPQYIRRDQTTRPHKKNVQDSRLING